MNIGDRLKNARLHTGMTQKQVAAACGMADSAIRKYESGVVTPKLENLCRIARALNTTVSELVPSEYWGTVTPEEANEAWEGGQARANAAMKKMTEEGRDKVADYAEDILPRYQKDAPNSETRKN